MVISMKKSYFFVFLFIFIIATNIRADAKVLVLDFSEIDICVEKNGKVSPDKMIDIMNIKGSSKFLEFSDCLHSVLNAQKDFYKLLYAEHMNCSVSSKLDGELDRMKLLQYSTVEPYKSLKIEDGVLLALSDIYKCKAEMPF